MRVKMLHNLVIEKILLLTICSMHSVHLRIERWNPVLTSNQEALTILLMPQDLSHLMSVPSWEDHLCINYGVMANSTIRSRCIISWDKVVLIICSFKIILCITLKKDGPFHWWCDLGGNPAGQID